MSGFHWFHITSGTSFITEYSAIRWVQKPFVLQLFTVFTSGWFTVYDTAHSTATSILCPSSPLLGAHWLEDPGPFVCSLVSDTHGYIFLQKGEIVLNVA